MVFDEPLPSITASAGEGRQFPNSQRNVDRPRSCIGPRNTPAPVYRKAWWPQHRAANLAWERMIREPLKLHGEEILSFITKNYGMQWPAAGYPVHMSAYSNWAGAYSIVGNVLVVSSLAPDLTSDYGLETIFHEGMHQWDEGVQAALSAAANRAARARPRRPLPRDGLLHRWRGRPQRDPRPRPLRGQIRHLEPRTGLVQTPLDEIWKPYLDGKGTRDDALTELLTRTGLPPKQ